MTSLQRNSIMQQTNAWRRAGAPLPVCNEANVCDEETRRDVDLMILDYIVCAALTSILHERIADREGAEQQQEGIHGCDRWLEIAEATLHLFKTNNPGETLSDDIKFKIKTLNFSNLFFRRFKRTAYLPSRAALAAQRKESRERAERWLEENSFQETTPAEELDRAFEHVQPISASQIDENRRTFLDHMAVRETEEYEFDIEASVTLCDILPELMELCDSAPDAISDDICTIAVLFMLHAAIEQGLLYGRVGREVLDETFAWGNKDDDHSWTETRDRHRLSLCPNADEEDDDDDDDGAHEDYGEQLKRIIYENPPFEFEEEVLNLIKTLQKTWDAPILNQLEQGKLFSLGDDEVAAFKRRVVFNDSGS
ncbi:hypothetical protein H109_05158 [Trichophyton interdigitale MR816]|uniref:Uncharacterized protein n=1 Tax=Trichophyton interdigitale (strain MR816) TaxID=1215338 RepID=A0A059J5J8_TRIIM|nr:hypothetical protein H109_05158 [Trichophyton interdigitale MR816]